MAALVWLALQTTDELIRQLGSDDVKTRDDAQAALSAMGDKIEAKLREATKHEDAEVRARAEALVHAIDLARGGYLLYLLENEETGVQRLMRSDFDGGDPTQIAGGDDESFIDAFDWSPDGSRIACLNDGSLHVVDRDGKVIATFSPGAEFYVNTLSWAPDGKSLAVEAVRHMGMEDAEIRSYVVGLDGKVVREFEKSDAEPVWSPDGRTVLFLRAEKLEPDRSAAYDVWVSDADGKNRRCVAKLGKPYVHADWSADGATVYYAYYNDDGQVLASVGADGKGQKSIAQWGANQEIVAILRMPDRERLLVSMIDATEGMASQDRLIVVDPKTGKQERLGPAGLPARGPALSPDGKRVAFASNLDLYVMDIDGKNPKKIAGGLSYDGSVRWARVGK